MLETETRWITLGTLTAALMFTLSGGPVIPGIASPTGQNSQNSAKPEVPVYSTSPPANARVLATRTTARWASSVNTSSKAAVDAAYVQNHVSGLSVRTGWTGSNSSCTTGTSSATSRAATLRSLNYARSMAGLAPVSFSSTLNSRSQRTALIMSANRSLSHNPPSYWRCWNSTGATNAGVSNLALTYPSISSSGVVAQYLTDSGSNNRSAGHRRWLLNPFSTEMGSASTDYSNAIAVIGPTSSTRPNPAWVAWPTAGYFPSPLEPAGRWSLSSGNRAINFTYATVRVYRDGTLLKTVKNPVASGYAMPTLVWEVPTSLARSGTFRVEVSGIRKSGTTQRYSHAYYVKMFAPSL